ncbi:MAG TPA: hypothetical protein VK843_06250 [Planctomycetota bacterium]|nr:hypothetical protein [Planctomycetota bacterium]
MGPAALVLAWCLSLMPLLLERGGSLDLGAADASPRVALIGLVWIALAGMPRAAVGIWDPRAWWVSTMVALPVLVLGFALDQASGSAGPHPEVHGLAVLGFVALAALAADLARRRPRAHAVHAALWFACVAGVPLFAAALGWGAREVGSLAPAWTRSVASFSPLQWSMDSLLGRAPPSAVFAALAGSVALCAIAALTSRGESA